MSDAAVTVIVAGVIQVTVLIVGLLKMQLQLKHGAERTEAVQEKVEENTVITSRIDERTNGATDALHDRIKKLETELGSSHDCILKLTDKFTELETYSHKAKHALANELNAINLKIERMLPEGK